MTNTVYPYDAIRSDDESCSSSMRVEDIPETQTEIAADNKKHFSYDTFKKLWLPRKPKIKSLSSTSVDLAPHSNGEVLGSSNLRSIPFIELEIATENFSSTSGDLAPHSNDGEVLWSSNLRSIPFIELEIATENFHPDNLLGEGPFGSVFKGWINEETLQATNPGTGIEVAVKKIHTKQLHGPRNWLEEIHYLGRFSHPNLVKMVGYCLEDAKLLLLVYEFMSLGSLEDHLFRGDSHFSWSLMLKVIFGATKCLDYLHKNKVVHGNVKPSNILLDSNYNAKLSFGVSTESPNYLETICGDMHFDLDLVNQYTDLECFGTGLTCESDVYSFGVVLLEMLLGQRLVLPGIRLAYFNRYSAKKNLVALASLLNGRRRLRGTREKIYDLAIGYVIRNEYCPYEKSISLESILKIGQSVTNHGMG